MTRELFLDPPRAAGPITLGMPVDTASALLRTLVGYLEREPGIRPNPTFAHYASGRSSLPEDPDDSDGRHFASVLVAAPGYYDGPRKA